MTSTEGSVTEASSSGPSAPRLMLAMLLLTVVGGPLVYVLWGAVNHLLLGELDQVRLALVLPAAAVFLVLVIFVSRLVRRWEGQE
ncbi:MAG: hypothetical protein R3223_01000 [Longimicrobiales bacterium]|nr:hypothetical protein [Longimicrobiales bacterium]